MLKSLPISFLLTLICILPAPYPPEMNKTSSFQNQSKLCLISHICSFPLSHPIFIIILFFSLVSKLIKVSHFNPSISPAYPPSFPFFDSTFNYYLFSKWTLPTYIIGSPYIVHERKWSIYIVLILIFLVDCHKSQEK